MKKLRSFFTILFLLISLVIILFIVLYDKRLLVMIINEIGNYILPAGIASLIFLILLSAGIASHSTKSLGSLIGNGFFQLAILELFLFSAGLVYYKYNMEQPGHIIIQLEPETVKDVVNLKMKYQSPRSSSIDTVIAPVALHNQSPGTYTFETVDQDVVFFLTDITLEPREIETITIPVVLNFKTLAVQTEPEGAEIWIDGALTSKTPDTLDIFNKDTIILAIKMQGYQIHIDTMAITENTNLGVIPLSKLYTLRIYCDYSGLDYTISDMHNNIVFSAMGNKSIQLAEGRYRITYSIGEGQTESKWFRLNYNYTINLPYE
jgi:hypothetical protein